MRILLPVDGSVYSAQAAEYIVARQTMLIGKKPVITLINVQEPLSARSAALGQEKLEALYRDEAEKAFALAKNLIAAAGLHCEEVCRIGDPAECIAEEVKQGQHNLVIIGARGRTPMEGLLFGSVTAEVISKTNVPILVLRGHEVPCDRAAEVGIAVDGTVYSRTAARFMTEHPALFGQNTVVTAITVVNDYEAEHFKMMQLVAAEQLSRDEASEIESEEFEASVSEIRRMFETSPAYRYREVCLKGDPSEEIARYASSEHLDLLVMGSHGYTPFESLLIGSVMARVAAESDTPILIVRPKNDESDAPAE